MCPATRFDRFQALERQISWPHIGKKAMDGLSGWQIAGSICCIHKHPLSGGDGHSCLCGKDGGMIVDCGETTQMNAVHAPIDGDTVQAITRLIVERFDPEQVILFGSHARREAGRHSDLDLLVVLRANVAQPRRGNPIRRAIAEHFVLPVDVIVRSPEILAEQGSNPQSALYKVLAEGEVLYERNAA